MPSPGINQRLLYGGVLWPSPVPLGNLFYQDFSQNTSLSGWTNTIPNTTLSIVSNKLQIATTSAAGVYNILAIDTTPLNQSQLNNWSMEIVFNTAMTLSSTSFGPRLCRKFSKTTTDVTTGSSAGETSCYFDTRSTAAGFCNVSIKGVVKATSAAGFAITNGDRLRATMTGNGFTITALFENLTTGASSTISHTITTSSVGDVNSLRGNYSILSLANGSTITHQIESVRVYSSYYRYADLGFIGDSITNGFCASTAANSWANTLMASSSKRYVKFASPSNTCQGTIDCINEILYIKPQTCVFMIGGNDAAVAWDAPRQAAYQSLISQVRANGSRIIHCLIPPRDSTDMTTINTWITSNYPGDIIINTFTPLATGTALNNTYDSGDGIHPNNAGHALLASTVASAIPSYI